MDAVPRVRQPRANRAPDTRCLGHERLILRMRLIIRCATPYFIESSAGLVCFGSHRGVPFHSVILNK